MTLSELREEEEGGIQELVHLDLFFFLCFREERDLWIKCAATAMNSKMIAQQKDFFSKMVVDAVCLLDDLLPLNMIGIKKVQGGSLEARGVCLK